jgi:hypothetical protein
MSSSSAIFFSICTLVTNKQEYNQMQQSFISCGFTDDCEYLMIDNSQGNVHDAYSAIRYFLNTAKGKYVIVVHQDVLCVDTATHLKNCLLTLTQKDDKWAICGNAGAKGYHQEIMYINTSGRIETTQNLPCKVNSLDENLLIIDAQKRLTISADFGGFHFYGTDLCIIADFLGYTSYVIPFMVNHLSSGNLKDMEKYRKPFINTYAKKLQGRYIQTTCTKFYLSNSSFKNKLYNTPFIFFFIKAWQRFKYNKELATNGNLYKKEVRFEKPKTS